jgi:hypothetical protein
MHTEEHSDADFLAAALDHFGCIKISVFGWRLLQDRLPTHVSCVEERGNPRHASTVLHIVL